jgi:hypothetical protein
MRIALALLMALHGIAHLPGFLVPWKLTQSADLPYTTTLLAGRVDVGGGGIRAVGVLWLLTAMAFVAAAFATWTARSGWLPLATGCALVSLVLSVLSLPAARIGVGVNVVVLAWLLLGAQLGWFGARAVAG